MNHRWNDPIEVAGKKVQTCKFCGLRRRLHTFITYRAIMNHPPWEINKYETGFIYWYPGESSGTEMTQRPSCKR